MYTPQTQQKFLQQVFTGTTSTTINVQQKGRSKPNAAAGSRAQLTDNTEVSVKQESEDTLPTKPRSRVNILPFEVKLMHF